MVIRARMRPCLVFVFLLALLSNAPSDCAETGSGAYWPGFRNFMSGVIPSKPGLYFRNDLIVYSATAPRVVLNGLPVANVSATAVLDIVELEYVFPRKLWGAKHAIVVTQPLIWGSFRGQVIGTNVVPSGRKLGAGDTVVSPLFLGWHTGNLHQNVNLAFFIPNGDYDVHRVVNLSRNFWTLDFEYAATNFDPKTGWELTGVLGYSVNTENTETDYRSGDVLHLDFVIGKTLPNGVKPGLLGYAWVQVTPDSGPGALFGSFESRVFGIGPGVQWKVDKNLEVTLRYYHEFGARDHVEGDQFAFTLRTAF